MLLTTRLLNQEFQVVKLCCLLCLSLSCVWSSQCSHCRWVIYFWLPLLFSLTFISDISLLRHFIVPLFYCCDTHLLWHCYIPTLLCSYFPLYMSRHYFIVYIQHIFSAFITIYYILKREQKVTICSNYQTKWKCIVKCCTCCVTLIC